MPQIIPLQLDTVPVGQASDFRNTINNNFSKIVNYFEENGTGTGVIVSATQPAPGEQRPGEFWYKIL